MKILHGFADTGAECPALSRHGEVLRFGHGATGNQWSDTLVADAEHLPIDEGVTFDLGIFHPPCGGVSPMSDTKGNSRDEWPDLVPVAREIARQYCDHYVIENKPRESLDAEVELTGQMFGLRIEYRRAFETSFPVEQPRDQRRLADTSPFYYTERSPGWWASVKGSSTDFGHQHLAKNTIPAAYIDYLMRHYYIAIDDGDRPDYSDYDKEMDTQRKRQTNAKLTTYE